MARDPYRRQIRAARRSMPNGRKDPFQVIILGPDQSLGLIALAALSRWAYQHRTAFTPFAVTIAAFTIAAWTHPHHARYWLPVAGMTIIVTVVTGIPHQLLWSRPAGKVTAKAMARMWAACGIDRGTERAYAATVIAVTGGWLAAAIGTGPATKPLPLIAGIATVILAVPWWFHRGAARKCEWNARSRDIRKSRRTPAFPVRKSCPWSWTRGDGPLVSCSGKGSPPNTPRPAPGSSAGPHR